MPKVKLQVQDEDLKTLRELGIDDATIRENRLRTEYDSDKLGAILNRGSESLCCIGGGLVIPYRDLSGKVNGFARVRPHTTRTRDGKPIKYEQPKGEASRAYFPATILDKLNDGESPIFVTEGEKKALALSQSGMDAIGIGGVWSWKKKGTDELIDDLAGINWGGRDVFIVFDYDEKATTRANIKSAMRRLARALLHAGVAEVYNVELPPGDDGSKMGADDFLMQYSGKELQKLIDQAEPVSDEATRNTIIKIIKSPALANEAYLGFCGKFLRAVAPFTEATDAGVLAHLLPAVGTIIGPRYHVWRGNKQPPRVNFVLVGPTNCGRKGTSLAPVDLLMQGVDSEFWNRQRVNGLSSGEGLIQFVADRQEKDKDGNLVVPVEKRVCVIEEEFSRVLANIRREGNILSQIIRSAFDSRNLATLTVIPRQASGAHISIVGHITPTELTERLDHVEMANGFGNRFLWLVTKSDKVMPSTAPIPNEVFTPFVKRLGTLHNIGQESQDHPVELSKAAQKLWEQLYLGLREDRPCRCDGVARFGDSAAPGPDLCDPEREDRRGQSAESCHSG